VGGWFFEGLEQAVLRGERQITCVVDDHDAPSALHRAEGDIPLHLTDLVYTDLASLRQQVDLAHIGMPSALDLSAGHALAASPRARRLRAEQCLPDADRERVLSDPTRAADQVRVGSLSVGEPFAQSLKQMRLPEHVAHFSPLYRRRSMKRLDGDARFALICKALGHPLRARIVGLLADRDECIVGELASHFGVAQSTMSEHLRVLKAAGLVQGTIEGPRTCYCLDPRTLTWFGAEVARRLGPFGSSRPRAARPRRLRVLS
jgi:hypothetical protein